MQATGLADAAVTLEDAAVTLAVVIVTVVAVEAVTVTAVDLITLCRATVAEEVGASMDTRAPTALTITVDQYM